MKRALTYLNLLTGLLLVAALRLVYWSVWRPLPQTSGEVTAGVTRPVSIRRDSQGVPHIRAATIEEALFAQGYVTAQDRLWQMDAIRRLASGELSEIIGPATLTQDREARQLRVRRIAERAVALMPPADRRWLAAYARGVNAFLDSHRRELPVEFHLLDYQPRPWSPADSFAVALQMHRQMTNSWEEDVKKADLLEKGDPAKIARLFAIRTGREELPGSNAWAISGQRTASGKPILANDPHLAFTFPSTWYQVHLQADGLDVAGVSLPGVPAVIIGHNRRIAWGVTNLGYDVQDLYIERMDLNTGQYLTERGVAQAVAEEERIAVRGQPVQTLRQWVTRHGPASIRQGDRILALRWAAAEPESAQFPMIDLNRAGNWTEFRAALERYPGPGMNFVYADGEGHIGYQAAGRLPNRPHHDGDLPVDGASGQFEWDGWIPFAEMPSAFDPPSGLIVTANQNPWPVNTPRRIHGGFAPPYRANQIRALLNARAKGWKAADMLAIQTDIYSASLHRLAQAVVQAVDRKGMPPGVNAATVTLLRDWNGQMRPDGGAPYLITLTYLSARRLIADRAAPGKGAAWSTEIAHGIVDRLVTERPKDWFVEWDEVLREALRDGAGTAERNQGPDPAKWRYGALLEVTITHPVLAKLPLPTKVPLVGYLAEYLQRAGPVAMGGSTTTIKQTSQTLGPSMRFIAELGDWDQSLLNITIGQSGQPFSRHYRDQWRPYREGRSFPMRFAQLGDGPELILRPDR